MSTSSTVSEVLPVLTLEQQGWQDPMVVDPHKTGNRPKQLVAIESYGYQVGRGRGRRIVNPDDVYKLAAMGCTDKEIATWFDVAYDTLKYNFTDIIAKGREDAKQALRQAMLKNALNGNAALQIFLAKNWLGMSDNPISTEDKQVLPWSDDDDEDADHA